MICRWILGTLPVSQPDCSVGISNGIMSVEVDGGTRSMGENIVLSSFLLLPVLTGLGLRLFFRRFRLHDKKTVFRLLAGNCLVFLFLCSVIVPAGELYFPLRV